MPQIDLGKIKGEDGHTPVKGTDYWTPEDQEGMILFARDTVLGLVDGGFVSFKEGEEPTERKRGFLFGKILADFREVTSDGN